MDDHVLQDIQALLSLCAREKAWPRQRSIIEPIEERYGAAIREMCERRMRAAGWTLHGNTWSRAA